MMEENLNEILERHLQEIKEKIAQRMGELGRNASGWSVSSLRTETDRGRGILWGAPSFLTMERGRGPGRVPADFKEIIRQWIIDKGIAVTPIPSKRQNTRYTPQERGLNAMAGAIARHISISGTSLWRQGGFDDNFTTAMKEELEALSKEVAILYSKRLEQASREGL